ncbi:winged helix-turn-helix transcriptional regulator [Streptomyces sp. NPDC093085]|uniref:winged helix-turn-helix transcriptional regulator n=1 Tax=Streptomyces sp. NPDC093085 TaxID=3155068 RepID=UPI0034273E39
MRMHNADQHCGIAQAAVITGDWWNVLVLREIARGHVRFDALAAELGLSRKVLTERLGRLVAAGVLRRSLYQRRPVRYEYLLTEAGLALLPVLVAMQEWGDRWVLGEGAGSGGEGEGEAGADAAPDARGDADGGARGEAEGETRGDAGEARVRSLATEGARLPYDLRLPSTTTGAGAGTEDPVVAPEAGATVLFTYAAAYAAAPDERLPRPFPHPFPRLFRDAWPDFRRAGLAVRGVSTQPPYEQSTFARAEAIPYPLLSDAEHRLTAALRLPVFRSGGRLCLRRLVLVLDREGVVRHTLFPAEDMPGLTDEVLRLAKATAAEALNDKAPSREPVSHEPLPHEAPPDVPRAL